MTTWARGQLEVPAPPGCAVQDSRQQAQFPNEKTPTLNDYREVVSSVSHALSHLFSLREPHIRGSLRLFWLAGAFASPLALAETPDWVYWEGRAKGKNTNHSPAEKQWRMS